MQRFAAVVLSALPAARAAQTNPLNKVVQLLTDLQSKIAAQGQDGHQTYAEFAEWCEDRSKNLAFDIKTGHSEAAGQSATIEKEASMIASFNTKVEELSGNIATDEADLKAAKEIRDHEAAGFAKEEKELMEVIDTLDRASRILEREMAKGGVSMLQNAAGIARALGALVQASAVSSADANQLVALVQNSQGDAEEDNGAPDAAVYAGQSDGIINTLRDLQDKAQQQLSDARQTEMSNIHAYQLLQQSLEDEVKYANKEMVESRQGLGASGEKKAAAEGDLDVTNKNLKADQGALAQLKTTCMTKAEEFEAAKKSRDQELKALTDAKQALTDATSGAESLSYGSFLQLTRATASSRVQLAGSQAVRLVRDLARKHNSPALAQLAARMDSASHNGAQTSDVFAKVKGLVRDMIEKLEEDANNDATHKAYCDKELAETTEKRADKTAEIEKLTSSIDIMSARSAQLKSEVSELQKSLSALAKSQAEMDKLRQEEKSTYAKNKADMDQGIQGVKLALKVLREYYAKDDKAHAAAEGAGGNVIGLLEVVESDFSQGLIEMTAEEESSAAAYDKETKENQIVRSTQEQDVKYKNKESTGLDKSIAETTSDREGVDAELSASNDYLKTLQAQCIAKAETFEQRKARYESELAGLKEALQILEGETALLQRSSKRSLRANRKL